jgi:hypothetical protein
MVDSRRGNIAVLSLQSLAIFCREVERVYGVPDTAGDLDVINTNQPVGI